MKTSEVWKIIEDKMVQEKAWQKTCCKSAEEVEAYLIGYENGMQTLLAQLIKKEVIDNSAQEKFDERKQDEAEKSFKTAREFDRNNKS